jgi:hypothetical protein
MPSGVVYHFAAVRSTAVDVEMETGEARFVRHAHVPHFLTVWICNDDISKGMKQGIAIKSFDGADSVQS